MKRWLGTFPKLGYLLVAARAAASLILKLPLVLIRRNCGDNRFDKLIMDRAAMAGDNGEALFRFMLSEGHRNVAFAISLNSKCGRRLRADGFGSSLIQPFTVEYWVALAESSIVASSQRDVDVHLRLAKYMIPSVKTKAVYLRHGIQHTANTLIDVQHTYSLICCSVDDELEHLRQVFSSHGRVSESLQKVGMARFDRYELFRGGPSVDALLVPTWRSGKVSILNSRKSGLKEFVGQWSDFAQELLRAGVSTSVLLHPMLDQQLIVQFKRLGVKVLHIPDIDVQRVISEAKVLITDYSSLALEALFARASLVLFRSDVDHSYQEFHLAHSLEFDLLAEKGFHICASVACAVSDTIDQLQSPEVSETQEAIREVVFAGYPTNSCAAIVEAIEAL